MHTALDVAHVPMNGFENEGELPGGKNVRADVCIVIRVIDDGYVHGGRPSTGHCTNWLPCCPSPALARRTSVGSAAAVRYAPNE